jgi:Tfp pilus assembly protein PilO
MALGIQNKQLQKLMETPQGKTYTVLGVTIITVLIMFMLAIRPAYISITNRISENNKKQEYIDEANNKIGDLQELNNQANTYDDAINYLNNFFLDDTAKEAFTIGNIINIADNRNLTIDFIRVDEAEPLPENEFEDVSDLDILAQNTITINARGSISNTRLFIQDLENLGEIMNIENINLSIEEEEDDDNWRLSVQANFYFWDTNDFKLN